MKLSNILNDSYNIDDFNAVVKSVKLSGAKKTSEPHLMMCRILEKIVTEPTKILKNKIWSYKPAEKTKLIETFTTIGLMKKDERKAAIEAFADMLTNLETNIPRQKLLAKKQQVIQQVKQQVKQQVIQQTTELNYTYSVEPEDYNNFFDVTVTDETGQDLFKLEFEVEDYELTLLDIHDLTGKGVTINPEAIEEAKNQILNEYGDELGDGTRPLDVNDTDDENWDYSFDADIQSENEWVVNVNDGDTGEDMYILIFERYPDGEILCTESTNLIDEEYGETPDEVIELAKNYLINESGLVDELENESVPYTEEDETIIEIIEKLEDKLRETPIIQSWIKNKLNGADDDWYVSTIIDKGRSESNIKEKLFIFIKSIETNEYKELVGNFFVTNGNISDFVVSQSPHGWPASYGDEVYSNDDPYLTDSSKLSFDANFWLG